jgi:hypothetical protein
MNKTPYKVEIIVEVEHDEKICHNRIKKSLRTAVKNALDDAHDNGFTHPEAHNITITPISVDVK